MSADSRLIAAYGSMWPRAIFDNLITGVNSRARLLAKDLEFLRGPGIYVLYRDDIPHYIGKADKLIHRLWHHANSAGSRYYNFWNFFSVFVIPDAKHRTEIEGVLIAAMPTANSANPKLLRQKFPPEVRALMRQIRRGRVGRLAQRE